MLLILILMVMNCSLFPMEKSSPQDEQELQKTAVEKAAALVNRFLVVDSQHAQIDWAHAFKKEFLHPLYGKYMIKKMLQHAYIYEDCTLEDILHKPHEFLKKFNAYLHEFEDEVEDAPSICAPFFMWLLSKESVHIVQYNPQDIAQLLLQQCLVSQQDYDDTLNASWRVIIQMLHVKNKDFTQKIFSKIFCAAQENRAWRGCIVDLYRAYDEIIVAGGKK